MAKYSRLHRPDIVFYLAGADPYEGDRLGRVRLSVAGLRERDRTVFDACRDRGLPVAVAMSGGYAPDHRGHRDDPPEYDQGSRPS
jgi:acetoin utilization deacetylase AcuC-like enzyme